MLYNKQEEAFCIISGQLFWCLTNFIVIFFPLYLIGVSLAAVGTFALGSGIPKLKFHLLPFRLAELLLDLYASALQSSWAVFIESIPICQCCTGKPQTEYCCLDVAFKCWIKGTNHFPGYAGSILLNAAQYVVRLFVERAHCWTRPHRLPTPLLQSCFPAGSQLVQLMCYSAFGIHEVFLANSYSLLRSLQKAILPCSVLINLSSLVSSTSLLRAHSILFILKMLNVVQT